MNLAAHLEAHTKVIGQPRCAMRESTGEGLGDRIRLDAHGPVQFKSRTPVERFYSVPPGQK